VTASEHQPSSIAPQQQAPPGTEADLHPAADHGEQSYVGSGRLDGKATVITGADSGIGRAVAIAFAREGADVLIAYLDEHDDAGHTARVVEDAGRRAVVMAGDVADPAHCRAIVATAAEAFGKLDVVVNNAAFQMSRESLEDIPDEEWDHTFATNITAMFHICKAALPHMQAGGSIINTSSINADQPKPPLLAVRGNEGGDRELQQRARRTRWGEGHPRQQRRPRPDLDAPDPGDYATRRCRGLRPGDAPWPARPARGGCARLRAARFGRGQLRIGRVRPRDRRPPDDLSTSRADIRPRCCARRARRARGCPSAGGASGDDFTVIIPPYPRPWRESSRQMSARGDGG